MHNRLSHFGRSLGPAFYLACSWTWCIGMFLPILLDRDFGHGAWLIFALCNVIGATAFVFVIDSAEKSRQFIQKHQRACYVFSWVTIAFQLFFIGWVARHLALDMLLPASVLLAVYFWSGARFNRLSAVAVIIWFFSVGVFVYYLQSSQGNPLLENLHNEVNALRSEHIYPLAILMFGFLLCPYLDLSFHHVLVKDNHNTSKLSYLLAFPLLFLTLLLFSLTYREEIERLFIGGDQLDVDSLFYLKLLLSYLLMQAGFTALVHYRQIQPATSKKINYWQYPLLAVCFLLSPLLGDGLLPLGISVNEMVYRSFISFYGILAPAYVLLQVFNTNEKTTALVASGVTKWSVTVFALICASVPMFLQSREYNYFYLVAVLSLLLLRLQSGKLGTDHH